MARRLTSDRVLFLAALVLICISVLMVYSASAVLALERYDQPYLFLTKQAFWVVLGMAILVVAMRVDYRQYRNDWFVRVVLGTVALMLVAVLFSEPINHSRRWFGFGGLGIQPSELAKIAVILFTALTLERRMHRIDDIRYSLPTIAVVAGGLCGLILIQPDFGTAFSLVAIVAVMVFGAGLHYRYLLGAAAASIPILYTMVWNVPYRRQRLETWWDPWRDPLGDGFQIIQSFIAVGTGGFWGQGLMAGVQKLFYLPEPHTDFIYAVIAEEFGLIGTTLVLACFSVVAWRGLRIGMRAGDAFGAFLALGLTTMVAVQAFVNMSVVLGLLPTKGIPLPLVSAGGSSLLVNMLGIGMLLNISQHQPAGT